MATDDPYSGLEVGYDIPARPGMRLAEVQTPALMLDLDALDRNLRRMADYAAAHGMALRPHGKMHKSVDMARRQIDLGACGLCAQKVSEAEAIVRGGIADVLVSNQVRDPVKIDRLARLPLRGARIGVCIDDPDNVAELATAVQRHGTTLDVLVELDCGAGRCGVTDPDLAVTMARAILAAPGLQFRGLQAYQGAVQHLEHHADRAARIDTAVALVRRTLSALAEAGIPCPTVTGGGTGTYPLETGSGVYTELQCGSYAVMDADYGRILDAQGARLDTGTWTNALFILTQVMSRAKPGRAVCDAGLKVLSVDSGLPVVFDRPDVTYDGASDEHGELADPRQQLQVGDKVQLVPGHCDPTINLHDWYVGIRDGKVETLWPVTARGKAF